MTSEPGKQVIAIQILSNISGSKGNQTIKFGKLIEYNKNIYLEKSFTECAGETIFRPFSKKIKIEHISGSVVSSFIQFVLSVCQFDGY